MEVLEGEGPEERLRCLGVPTAAGSWTRPKQLCLCQEPEGPVSSCSGHRGALSRRVVGLIAELAAGAVEQLFPDQLQDLVQKHQCCFLFEVAEQDRLSEQEPTAAAFRLGTLAR